MGGPRCDGCGRFARIAAEVPVMDVFKQYVEDWRRYCAICAPTQRQAHRDRRNETMSEPINWRDTRKWSWDTNGYAICPCCAAMIYGRFLDLHANMCGAIEAATAACAPKQPICSKCGGTDELADAAPRSYGRSAQHTQKTLARLRKALDMGNGGSLADIADRVEWLVEKYSRICARLQECAQRHKLGLGGEELDRVVVEEVDRLRSIVAGETKP